MFRDTWERWMGGIREGHNASGGRKRGLEKSRKFYGGQQTGSM